MSQYVETPTKAFTAGAAIAQHLRVKLSSGKLAAAGISDKEIGTIEAAAFADGDIVAVRLRSAQGTCKMVASGVVNAGSEVYTAASGKISGTYASGSYPLGVALETTTANNDIVEVLRNSHGDTSAT